MFLCCALIIAIIQYCNFCQLSFWMRSVLATVAGLSLLILLYSATTRPRSDICYQFKLAIFFILLLFYYSFRTLYRFLFLDSHDCSCWYMSTNAEEIFPILRKQHGYVCKMYNVMGVFTMNYNGE